MHYFGGGGSRRTTLEKLPEFAGTQIGPQISLRRGPPRFFVGINVPGNEWRIFNGMDYSKRESWISRRKYSEDVALAEFCRHGRRSNIVRDPAFADGREAAHEIDRRTPSRERRQWASADQRRRGDPSALDTKSRLRSTGRMDSRKPHPAHARKWFCRPFRIGELESLRSPTRCTGITGVETKRGKSPAGRDV